VNSGLLGARRELILVVDDDADIARFVEMNLRFEGFDVLVAHDGTAALILIEEHKPDLVILDVMMPRLDGVELVRRIRADTLTAALPVIMLTAKSRSADKVVALSAGADDYLVKPFDTLELVARVRATLRRNREVREVSPLTGLPGNARILREVGDRVGGGTEFAVCYVDIDQFKSVNDAYGFVRGDEFISVLARALHRAVTAAGPPPAFLGHVGGDDFVVVCAPDQVGPITKVAIAEFAVGTAPLYDEADLARGHLEVIDRRGQPRRAELASISIGVALSTNRSFADPREVVAVATEMKNVAKGQTGSYVAVDRRRVS